MKKTIIIELEIETENEMSDIIPALSRGIYRGLDSPPYYIAAPADVKINFIKEK